MMDRRAVTAFEASYWVRRASRFGRADDRLSRAISAVARIRSLYTEAGDVDALFDGGEWSAAANDRACEAAVVAALATLNFTPEQYNDALARRGSGRFAWAKGLYA